MRSNALATVGNYALTKLPYGNFLDGQGKGQTFL
jgi:hypothetical protein